LIPDVRTGERKCPFSELKYIVLVSCSLSSAMNVNQIRGRPFVVLSCGDEWSPVSSCQYLLTYSTVYCRFVVAGLQASFKQFGPLRIEWPGKDGKHPRYPNRGHELPGRTCHSNHLAFSLTRLTWHRLLPSSLVQSILYWRKRLSTTHQHRSLSNWCDTNCV